MLSDAVGPPLGDFAASQPPLPHLAGGNPRAWLTKRHTLTYDSEQCWMLTVATLRGGYGAVVNALMLGGSLGLSPQNRVDLRGNS